MEKSDTLRHYFLGTKSLPELDDCLKRDDICLFYLLSPADQLVVRLHLGYKNESGRLLHFRLRKKNELWQIEGDYSGASFDSLDSLLTHYRIFRGIDIRTGALSLLPIRCDVLEAEADKSTLYESI